MRPEKLHYLTNLAIAHRLETGSSAGFTKPLVRRLEREWQRRAAQENDYRSGAETYGYGDPDNILGSLVYISDRWACAFRIRWLLDGLATGKI